LVEVVEGRVGGGEGWREEGGWGGRRRVEGRGRGLEGRGREGVGGGGRGVEGWGGGGWEGGGGGGGKG